MESDVARLEDLQGFNEQQEHELSFDDLEKWYQDYIDIHLNNGTYEYICVHVDPQDPVFKALMSDKLDDIGTELRIQRAMDKVGIEQACCHECEHSFTEWPEKREETVVAIRPCSSIELEAAARKKCMFCAFIFSRVRDQINIFRKIERRLELLNKDLSAFIYLGYSTGRRQEIWLTYPAFKDSPHLYVPPGPSALSEVVFPSDYYHHKPGTSLDTANQLLDECIIRHERCSHTNLAAPSRLLYVAEEIPRLVIVNTLPNIPKYATLSYCWGVMQTVRLTRNSLASLLVEIPLTTLPKTLTDAISIAKSLHLAYIWIDALCIIQDERKDWEIESAKMRSIYGGSHINIAASSSTDVTGGCFRTESWYHGGFLARVTTKHYCEVRKFYHADLRSEITTGTPLANRAWAFQERLLAPRTLYFTKRGMFWECLTKFASEYLPDGYPRDQLRLAIPMLPELEQWNWNHVVEEYSKTGITQVTDRLPALAGVARRQQESTGGIYLAGMWKDRLLEQLNWRAQDMAKPRYRGKWIASSWTWVGLNAPVTNSVRPGKVRAVYAEIMNARTSLAGPDPYSAVTGGRLKLRCLGLIRGRHRTSKDAVFSWHDNLVVSSWLPHISVFLDYTNEDFENFEEDLYVLPLVYTSYALCGLILCASPSKGVFYRVGHFRAEEFDYEDRFEMFERAMRDIGTSASSFCYEINEGSVFPYVVVIE